MEPSARLALARNDQPMFHMYLVSCTPLDREASQHMRF
jgi:hypothetical protein